ncbi:hypothetical protein [Polycladidibacter hongkongensis]|uniref:hypothetical protein n=1 Tax=Polycladidibacter hongkongensis TaxID=1647556 RepID=UPI00082C06E2|nr:hypothetical protein [Pseudovibrio hongkongensis]
MKPAQTANEPNIKELFITSEEKAEAELNGLDASGFITAYKPEALVWNAFSVYKKYKEDFEAGGSGGTAGRIRADIRAAHFLADAVKSNIKLAANGLTPKNEESLDALTSATVLSSVGLVPTLVKAYIDYQTESMVAEIQKFHAGTSGNSKYSYEDGELTALQNQTDFKKLLEAHQKVLARKNETLSEEYHALATKLQQNDSRAETLQQELNHNKDYIEVQQLLDAALNADTHLLLKKQLTETRARAQDQLNQETQIAQRIKDIEESDQPDLVKKTEVDKLTAELEEIGNQHARSVDKVMMLDDALDTYTKYAGGKSRIERKEAADEIFQDILKHKTTVGELEVEIGKIDSASDQIRQESANLDSEIAQVMDSYEEMSARKNAFLSDVSKKVGFAGSLIGIGRGAATLAKDIQGGGSTYDVAGSATALGSTVFDSVSSFTELLSGKAAPKVGAAFGVLGAAAGVAAGGVSLATLAKQLDDPNLSPQQKQLLQAEIGLQGAAMALGVLEAGLSIAQTIVATGSKAASVLGKAVPLVGGLAALVTCINPAKWAEFDAKQAQIDQLRESDDYSASMLADLLDENLVTEKGFYGATTAFDAIVGVTSAALVASGIGAGIGVLVGVIGSAISGIVQAFQQVHIDNVAYKYAEKMRTAADGSEQSIEDFFEGSFEQQQQRSREAYEEFLKDMLQDGGFENAVTLGSQRLSSTDITLAQMSHTHGELGKTAKHFFEEFEANGNWTKDSIQLLPQTGDDIIKLPDSGGTAKNVYLTIMSPLMASGEESQSSEWTSKRTEYTKLEIKDLAGWIIEDGVGSNTTFNIENVVTSGQSSKGVDRDVDFSIKGGDGNDTLIAHDVEVTFDGGQGTDTANYSRLSNEELASGLQVSSSGANTIEVGKSLKAGTKYFKETIEESSSSSGKNTRTTEYRNVELGERDGTTSNTDTLKSIEILQATSQDDHISLRENGTLEQVYTFNGDDYVQAGKNTKIIATGSGDDSIVLTNEMVQRLTASQDPQNILSIDGGEGWGDTLLLEDDAFAAIKGAYETTRYQEAIANFAASGLTANNGQANPTALGFANMLSQGNEKPLGNLGVANIETVEIALDDAPDASSTELYGKSPFKTSALSGARSGSEAVDKIYHASDYESIVDQSLGDVAQNHFKGLHQLSTETYEGVSATTTDQMKAWTTSHQANTNGSQEVVSGQLSEDQLQVVSGKLYVEKGKTYTFKETSDDTALLEIEGTQVLANAHYLQHTQGSFTATKTGFVDFKFYALNNKGPGHYNLQVLQSFDGATTPGANAEFQSVFANSGNLLPPQDELVVHMNGETLSHQATLLGSERNNELTGSRFDDTLYGYAGNDVLDGGQGSDLLAGGEGADTYIFRGDAGFDVIVDLDRTHTTGDTISIEDVALSDMAASRYGKHLVLSSSATSTLTIANYFSDAASKKNIKLLYEVDGATLTTSLGEVVAGNTEIAPLQTLRANSAFFKVLKLSGIDSKIATANKTRNKSDEQLLAEQSASANEAALKKSMLDTGYKLGDNLIFNGDFEQGLNGWGGLSNSKLMNNGDDSVYSSEGSQHHLLLDGNLKDSAVFQFPNLETGKSYILTFDAAKNPNASYSSNNFDVGLNGKRIGTVEPSQDGRFEHFEYLITGRAHSNYLGFIEDALGDDGKGAWLDNIQVRELIEISPGNLLKNGSFEIAGAISDAGLHIAEVFGWHATNGFKLAHADQSTKGNVHDENYLQLDRTADKNTLDAIAQDLDLETGAKYQLTFKMWGDNSASASSNALQVLHQGKLLGEAAQSAKTAQEFSFEFFGKEGLDTLIFREFADGNDGKGLFLDNIHLQKIADAPADQSETAAESGLVKLGNNLIKNAGFELGDALEQDLSNAQNVADWGNLSGGMHLVQTDNLGIAQGRMLNLNKRDNRYDVIEQYIDIEQEGYYRFSFKQWKNEGTTTAEGSDLHVNWTDSDSGKRIDLFETTEFDDYFVHEFIFEGKSEESRIRVFENADVDVLIDDLSLQYISEADQAKFDFDFL